MLTHWLLSTAVVFLIIIEIVGYATLFKRWAGGSLGIAFYLCASSQVFYLLSFIGARSPWLHLFIAFGGCSLFIFRVLLKKSIRLKFPEVKHWAWFVLPAIWLILNFIQTLIPHSSFSALTLSMNSARSWFDASKHIVDPLNPMPLLATTWAGLYYHVYALTDWFNQTPSIIPYVPYFRSQISAQMLHFLFGQCLTIIFFSRILTNHQKLFSFWPGALFVSWILFAQSAILTFQPGFSADSTWAVLLFLILTVAFFFNKKHFPAGFCFSTALINTPLVQHSVVYTFLLLFLAITLFFLFYQRMEFSWKKYGLGLFLGVFPWMIINYLKTGILFFPFGERAHLGWFSNHAYELLKQADFLLNHQVLLKWMGLCVLLLGIKLGIDFAAQNYPKLQRWTLGLWIVFALIFVRFPIHFIWQNLTYANESPSRYLVKFHPNYDAKHWANLHLPRKSRLAWMKEDRFFYLNHQAVSIPIANGIVSVLKKTENPKEKVAVLCQLGITHLVSDKKIYRAELAGINEWLSLQPTTIVYSNSRVRIFDLKTGCNPD